MVKEAWIVYTLHYWIHFVRIRLMFHFFTFESTPFKFLKHGVVVSPFKLSFNPLRLKELASCSLPCAASSPPVDSLGCNTCHKIKCDQISGARRVALVPDNPTISGGRMQSPDSPASAAPGEVAPSCQAERAPLFFFASTRFPPLSNLLPSAAAGRHLILRDVLDLAWGSTFAASGTTIHPWFCCSQIGRFPGTYTRTHLQSVVISGS